MALEVVELVELILTQFLVELLELVFADFLVAISLNHTYKHSD